jgi:sulfite exporter TauE/SafE
MLPLFLVAFMMGMAGSFHCVGMCGPLALSLPIRNNGLAAKFSGALLYNMGRVVTYSFFGLLFGLIGKTVALFGLQQYLSIIAGLMIIMLVIMPKKYAVAHSGSVSRFFERLRSAIGNLFSSRNRSALFVIGLLNGLLPCGLVYMAVAGAIATGTVGQSVFFMAAFGLGTLPVMWSLAFFGNYIGQAVRQRIRSAYPYLMLLMACLLILRGMGLGIPYVSPKAMAQLKEVRGCCAKP